MIPGSFQSEELRGYVTGWSWLHFGFGFLSLISRFRSGEFS